MADVLIVSDDAELRSAVRAVFSTDDHVIEVDAGSDVLPIVCADEPDLVVLDLQIGNMGGMATCLDIRLEESADRIDHVPVLLLLDRRADVYLARRAQADGWLVKPVDPIRLRRAVRALLADEAFYDESYKPLTA